MRKIFRRWKWKETKRNNVGNFLMELHRRDIWETKLSQHIIIASLSHRSSCDPTQCAARWGLKSADIKANFWRSLKRFANFSHNSRVPARRRRRAFRLLVLMWQCITIWWASFAVSFVIITQNDSFVSWRASVGEVNHFHFSLATLFPHKREASEMESAICYLRKQPSELGGKEDGEKLYISRFGDFETNSAKICSFLSFCDSNWVLCTEKRGERRGTRKEYTSIKFDGDDASVTTQMRAFNCIDKLWDNLNATMISQVTDATNCPHQQTQHEQTQALFVFLFCYSRTLIIRQQTLKFKTRTTKAAMESSDRQSWCPWVPLCWLLSTLFPAKFSPKHKHRE